MGAAWVPEDAEPLAELLTLRALCASTMAAGDFPPGTATTRVGHLEAALGLTPKARATMRWRFVETFDDVAAPIVIDPADVKAGGWLEAVLAAEKGDGR